jgi:hypothetical protein
MNYGHKNKLKDDKLYETWIKSLSERTASRYRYGITAQSVSSVFPSI